MSGEMEFEGRTEQEAVERASSTLSVGRAELDYTVIDEGSLGLFGLGARPVRIRAKASQAAPAERRGPDDEDEGAGGITGPAPEKAERAREVAATLAEKMGMAVSVAVRDEDREIVVVLNEAEGKSDVAEMLGSSRPPGVPSFQFLLNKIVNRFPDDRKHIVVEAPTAATRLGSPRRGPAAGASAGHRQHEAPAPRTPPPLPEDVDPALAALGEVLAAKAKALGKVITIQPMAAADRRALHLTIERLEGVETVSEGEGLYRRIHIVPSAAKPGGPGGRKRRRRRRRRRGGAEGGEGGAVGGEGGGGSGDTE